MMLKSSLKRIIKFFNAFGLDPIKFIRSARGAPVFVFDFFRLIKQKKGSGFPIRLYPILDDRYKQGGTARGHYFHQDLLVAQKIFKASPQRHIDVGSRVDGFIAHIATFRKIEIIDIRELKSKVGNIDFIQADMMQMRADLSESCDSLSCLHAIEHFGLGRYGDPVDFDGHLKGLDNMHKILKDNGVFYFSVPIGPQRIEFNAHRVFSLAYLLEMFKGKFELVNFSYVDDRGDLWTDVKLDETLVGNNCDCLYGCGIFELMKCRND